MTVVDLNSDMGESFGAYEIGDDASMLSIVSSANVACGFHGGDALVMHETLRLASAKGVGVGAHPDLTIFGALVGGPFKEIARLISKSR